MNLNEIEAKCFIMALFIRDDGLRFLLGSGAYEFKDSQLMFAGNTIENDVVSIQGNDGYMLAGQVRRPSTQVFDGYIGDATVPKSEVEGYRRDFMAFFQKNHFYTVVYVMADGSAIQRRRGFLVDAPTSQELWQMYPEYHVALNFEDVNYYKYSENDDGEETYAKSADIGLAKVQYGGLIWDNDSEIEISGYGTNIELDGTMEGGAIDSVELNGDTTQTTYSGKNLYVNSQDFGGSNWNNYAAWTTDSSTYNGLVVKTRSNAWQGLSQTLSVESGKTYTFSLFVKAGSARNAGLYLNHYESGAATINPTSASISVTTEWQRYSATFSVTSSGTVRPRLELFENFDTPVYICGYQLEQNNSMTSFEPYVGGTASPNPDYPQNVNVVTGEQSIEVRGSKNLFNVSSYDGITQNTDGTVKSTKYYTNATAVSLHLEPSTRYTISIRNSNGELNGQGWGIAVNGTWINTTSGTGAVTTDANGDVTLTVGASSYGAIGGYNAFFQLEKGNQATTYEPYKGVTKTVNLGKNLFDKDNANTIAAYIQWTDPRVLNYSAGNSSVYIPCQPNTTYTISKVADNVFRAGSIEETPTTGITVYNAADNPTGTSITIATSSKAKYLVVFLRNNSSANSLETILASLQIEKGSTATTYAPYFTPIELCKIGDYQDYIYKSGEDWYIKKTILGLDMSSIASWEGGNKNFYSLTFDTNYGVIRNQPQISNIFTYSATSWAGEGKFGIATNTGALWLTISDSTVTSSNLSTWLGNKNGVIYAVLATPTDTKITDATLISELDSLLSATTYSDNTYITVSGDLASPLEITVMSIGGGGVVWDENGAEWEAGGGGEIVIVNVDSIENILPVWTIRGEAENPTLTNLTTGMGITYNGTVASGQTLVIDLLNKTAKLNGTSVISDVSGQWVEFKPGNNRVSYSTENANAPDSTIEWQEVVG